MTRALALALLLAGCAVEPPTFANCPGAVPVPAPLPLISARPVLERFAVRLELAREAERTRGDACAAASAGRAAWIER
jgi:hypothetical protein